MTEDINKKMAGLIRRCSTARFLVRSRNRAVFTQITTHQTELRKYFRQMAADLIVNEAIGIAYVEPIKELEDELDYRLGRSVTLSPLETLLLVFFRQKRIDHFSGEVEHEAPWISRERIREFLSDFSTDKEDRLFQKKFEKALERLGELQVLLPTDTEEQFEISPVCDVLLPGDRIAALNRQAKEYFAGKRAEDSGEASI